MVMTSRLVLKVSRWARGDCEYFGVGIEFLIFVFWVAFLCKSPKQLQNRSEKVSKSLKKSD